MVLGEQAPELYSAKIGLCTGPPTEAPRSKVRDVLICPVTTFDVAHEEFREHPPVASPGELRLKGSSAPVELGRGVRVDRLSNDEAELVFNACSARGHYFAPVRDFGQRFSFVREYEPAEVEDRRFHWDPDGVLYDALAYSRLIRDHGFSREWAARIVDYEDSSQMVVYTPGHELKLGYRVRRNRDWLDAEEALELRELLACYWDAGSSLPLRLTRAMWRFEYAYSVKWADAMLPVLVSGVEALLKTGRVDLTRQFAQRSSALAGELGVEDFDAELGRRMYDGRSDWVHGSHFSLLLARAKKSGDVSVTPIPGRMDDAMAEVALLQDVLRAAIRCCLKDADFRSIFENDDAIRARWPAPGD